MFMGNILKKIDFHNKCIFDSEIWLLHFIQVVALVLFSLVRSETEKSQSELDVRFSGLPSLRLGSSGVHTLAMKLLLW